MTKVRGIGFSATAQDDVNFVALGRVLDEAASLEVGFIELPLFGMDLIAGGRILPGQLKRLKSVIEGRSLQYTGHGPIALNFMQPVDITARHLHVARSYVELAAELGVVHLILHTGYTNAQSEADLEASYAAQRRAFSLLGDFAAAAGVVICVENIFTTNKGDQTALPSKLAREIDTIAHSHVRACLDFSHAAITCTARGADFMTEARALARVSRHLHLHDSFGDPLQLRTYSRSERVAYGLGDLHLPLGWGNIPWDEIMDSFAFEDDAVFNLELPQQYWYTLPDCIARIKGFASQAGQAA